MRINLKCFDNLINKQNKKEPKSKHQINLSKKSNYVRQAKTTNETVFL